MSYKFVFLSPSGERGRKYADGMVEVVPDIEIVHCDTREEGLEALTGAAACFGTLDPQLLAAAPNLQWLAAPAAGPPKGYYFEELIRSEVTSNKFSRYF